jgi:hypothetical protein
MTMQRAQKDVRAVGVVPRYRGDEPHRGAKGGLLPQALGLPADRIGMRFFTILVLLSALSCDKADSDPRPASSAEAPDPVPEEPTEPEKPPEPALADLSFEDAIAVIGPKMSDSVDAYSDGQVMLTLWATKALTWGDVFVKRDETSLAKIAKDSEPERGKRMCLSGTRVIQIMADRADDAKIFRGLLSYRYKPVSFIAVGSTGELVERSRARFCGIVAGNHAFSNVSGGQTQTALLIGMFDLPENRASE